MFVTALFPRPSDEAYDVLVSQVLGHVVTLTRYMSIATGNKSLGTPFYGRLTFSQDGGTGSIFLTVDFSHPLNPTRKLVEFLQHCFVTGVRRKPIQYIPNKAS